MLIPYTIIPLRAQNTCAIIKALGDYNFIKFFTLGGGKDKCRELLHRAYRISKAEYKSGVTQGLSITRYSLCCATFFR